MTSEPAIPNPGPQDPAFVQHLVAMRDHFQPVGAFEESLVDQIASGIWRLQRCAAAEECIFAPDPNESAEVPNNPGRTWLEKGKAINALSLYEGRIRRALEKDKAELRAAQAERQSAAAKSGAGDLILPPPSRPKPPHSTGKLNEPDAILAPHVQAGFEPHPLAPDASAEALHSFSVSSPFISAPSA